MIELGKELVSNFASASTREWLETNGTGGYASATVSGANTRRYHGLLVAATKPPLGRAVLLSKADETVIVGEKRFELSTNQYPGAVHPDGFRFLRSFKLDPFPVWTFDLDGLELKKKIFMQHGENTTIVKWSVENRGSDDELNIALEVRPLVAFRDHHRLRRSAEDFDTTVQVGRGHASIRPVADLPALHLNGNFASAEKTAFWYRNLEYAIEQERGFDFQEDLYQPFVLTFDLSKPASLIASTESLGAIDVDSAERLELKRRAKLVAGSKSKDPFFRQLTLAADQFIVERGGGTTVIAGYHWFSDWGRDTMIALPGLTLATGRPEIAKSVFTEFAKYVSDGMLPNRFPDVGERPEYNTVDATLWFFEAVRAYLAKTGDDEFVKTVLYEKLVDIIEWHIRGTRHNIHVDTDGLLCAGEPGVQLTWMDAKIGDWVVTPRTGKAVEIQALWYNALLIMAGLGQRFDDDKNSDKYLRMADVARDSFNGQFWNPSAECLFDVIDGESKDASIRPNQIFAVSLANTMLDDERARKVVEKVEAELLTPFGLRSLSPYDPRYVGTYIGSPHDRDASYHQGTVWGWLIGPFIDAYRKVHSDDPELPLKVDQFTSAFRSHLHEAMVGQISEIFDGEPPHSPRGCAAQAWSVAELLRTARK